MHPVGAGRNKELFPLFTTEQSDSGSGKESYLTKCFRMKASVAKNVRTASYNCTDFLDPSASKFGPGRATGSYNRSGGNRGYIQHLFHLAGQETIETTMVQRASNK